MCVCVCVYTKIHRRDKHKTNRLYIYIYLSILPQIFRGAPWKINGADGTSQGNLTALYKHSILLTGVRMVMKTRSVPRAVTRS